MFAVKSAMSGETIEEFELLEDAKEFADAGGYLGTCTYDRTTTEYARRYVVDDMGKSIYAKNDWPKLSELEITKVLEERQIALDRQQGWINDFMYSTVHKSPWYGK